MSSLKPPLELKDDAFDRSPPSWVGQPSDGALSIHAWHLLLALSLAMAALVIASTLARLTMAEIEPGSYRGIVEILQRFDLDHEHNIPTWFSSQLLFLCSLVLALIGGVHRKRREAFAFHWLALSAIFIYLSLDEAANLHEILIVPIRRRLDLHGLLYFAWVIPGFFAVAVVGVCFLPFLRQLDARTRRRIVVAGGVYLCGALGMELIGGACAESLGFESLPYLAAMTIEETLEMLGAALLLNGLLGYLANHWPRLQCRFV